MTALYNMTMQDLAGCEEREELQILVDGDQDSRLRVKGINIIYYDIVYKLNVIRTLILWCFIIRHCTSVV